MKLKKISPTFLALLLYALCIYGTMAMMSIGAGVVGVVWIALRRKKIGDDLRKFRDSPLVWPTLLFGFACIWSLVWARLTDLSFLGMRPTIDFVQDSRKIWHLFFPFVLAPAFSTLSITELRRVTKAWLFFGIAAAAVGIVQYYVPIFEPERLPHLDYHNYERGTGWLAMLKGSYHATGFAGFHLSYASIIAFPAAVSLALVAVLYRRGGFNYRTRLAIGAPVLFFLANVLTYSKMAWAAMPLTVVLIAVIGFRGWLRYSILALVAAFCVVWGTSSEVRLRFQGTDTIKERVEVWSANVEMIKQHPIFGVGWHRNAELSRAYYEAKNIRGFSSHAHNNFIDQWATTGLFGLGFYLWWTLVVLLMCFRVYNMNHDLLWRSLGLGLLGGWFCLHLEGMTQANWWDAKVLHQIGWCTAMTMEVYRRYGKRKFGSN